MTRLGRRFPVHRGYNPPLLNPSGIVTRDSIGAGAATNASTASPSWTHTPIGKPNLAIMWVNLFYLAGSVSATLNGRGADTLLFNYNYANSTWGAYVECWIWWNPGAGPWTMVYSPGTAGAGQNPYTMCNSVAYNGVGKLGATVSTASTPVVMASAGPPGAIISTGSCGWRTGGGQFAKLQSVAGETIIWDSVANFGDGGEPMSMGEVVSSGPTQSIAWTSTAGDGYGLCAVNLLPKIPQPML